MSSSSHLFLHPELRDVEVEKQLYGPVEDDTHPCGRGRELEHVHRLPDEPGKEARQLEAHEVGHCRASGQRHHFSKEFEPEGQSRPPGETGDELPRQSTSLAERDLRGGDIRYARMYVNLRGIVAKRIDVWRALYLEELVDLQAAVLRLGQRERRHHRAHLVAGRPDHAVARNQPTILKQQALVG